MRQAKYWVITPLLLAAIGCGGGSSSSSPSSVESGPWSDPKHLENVFSVKTNWYVNPDYTANVASSMSGMGVMGRETALKMEKVGAQPTAVWLDTIDTASNMRTHLDRALANGNDLITFVLYDLPNRDCAAAASNGELPPPGRTLAQGMSRYKVWFIDPIARTVRDPKYASLTIVLIVEPDSLPNLVTNVDASKYPKCVEVAQGDDGKHNQNGYVEGIAYAIDRLSGLDNVYLFLDVAHPAWLGWNSNRSKFLVLLEDLAGRLRGGKAAIDGFVSNISGYVPLVEPFLTTDTRFKDPSSGRSVSIVASAFYDTNPLLDELTYMKTLWEELTAEGWPKEIQMVVDTSRNGWGPSSERPSGLPEDATSLTEFVDRSKVDRRSHRGQWCNQAGAGIGEFPRAVTADDTALSEAHISALIWVKPPGESDGSADMGNPGEGKKADPSCAPNARLLEGGVEVTRKDGVEVGTNALAGAPPAAQWFGTGFEGLVRNAYPPIP